MTIENRNYDEHIAALMSKLDHHSLLLEEHTFVIKQNREDLDAYIKAQVMMNTKVDKHITDEVNTLLEIKEFLRDLKGLNRIASYAANVLKWAAIIGTVASSVIFLWDKAIHLLKVHN